jgi:hypothetical protein
LLLIAIFIQVSIENGIRLEGSETGLIIQFVFLIYVGQNANHWVVEKFNDRGFTDIATGETYTADAAIAEVANQK